MAEAGAPAAERGGLEVADRVVKRVAEFAALEHPAVVRHASTLGRVTGHDLPDVTATVAGRQARLALDIAVRWPAPLAETAAQVRATVIDQVARLAGVQADRVDVSVQAVVHDPDRSRGRVS